jgi:single-stranded DNA-binding protein
MVIGNVQARAYINNNGEAAASLDLRAREVRFLGGRGDGDQGGGWSGGGQRGGGQRSGSQQSQRRDDRASNYPESPGSIDDIPF